MADLSSKSLPAPAPQASDVARVSVSAATQARVAQRNDRDKGPSFGDELSRTSAPAPAPRDDAPAPKARAAKPDKPDQNDASDNAPKKSLAPLRKIAQQAKAVIESSPAVALLTGRFDRVDSNDLPGLIGDGKFVTRALDAGDLGQFMAKPAPVADLVKSLDLPPQVLQAAQQMGLDGGQLVSPNELLKALGLDPQRIFSQLKGLEERLASEGLTPDLLRATAPLAGVAAAATKDDDKTSQAANASPLASSAALGAAAAAAASQMAAQGTKPSLGGLDVGKPTVQTPVLPTAPSPGKMAAGGGRGASDVAGLGNLLSGLGLQGNGLGAAGDASDLGDLVQDMPPALLALAQPRAGFTAALAKADAKADALAVIPVVVEDASDAGAAVDDDAVGAADGVKDAGAKVGKDVQSSVEKAAQAAAPSAHKATFDGFASLGDRLRQADVTQVSLEDAAPAKPQAALSSLEEQLARAGLAVGRGAPGGSVKGLAQMTAMPTAKIAPAPVTMTPAQLTPDQVAAQATGVAGQPGAVGLTQAPGTGQAVVGRAQPKLQTVSVDDLRLAAPAVAVRSAADARTGDGAGDEEGRDGNEGRRDGKAPVEAGRLLHDLGNAAHVGLKHEGHAFGAHVAGPEAALTTQQRAELVQKVIDRAAMLSKEGGGSMRLDLHTAGLGQVELAVNLDKDKVDVRVMTGSDRVREAMLSDLTKLKDALTVQNVRLGNVEVGVDRRQPQSQSQSFNGFAGNMSGQRQGSGGGQSFAGQQDGRRAPAQARLDAFQSLRRPVMPSMPAVAAATPGAGGRIAVRV